jgi:hypothetical protein
MTVVQSALSAQVSHQTPMNSLVERNFDILSKSNDIFRRAGFTTTPSQKAFQDRPVGELVIENVTTDIDETTLELGIANILYADLAVDDNPLSHRGHGEITINGVYFEWHIEIIREDNEPLTDLSECASWRRRCVISVSQQN